MQILVTGGAGFIGSALVRYILTQTDHSVINVDVLTYAANTDVLVEFAAYEKHHFVKANICDHRVMSGVFERYTPDCVIHLAAETHVDNSIDGPNVFIQTNVVGTQTLLELSRSHWQGLEDAQRNRFRYLQVSTDEVYGDLGNDGGLFTETSSYCPSSPYSASKAAADHLVRAWGRTYGLPVLVTCCSNNYGPYQHDEKLIPLMIKQALAGEPLPIYGDGQQVRDWLYVDDHAAALMQVLEKGTPGETYNVGANNEHSNLDIVKRICSVLEDKVPVKPDRVSRYEDLISFVEDRPGHDHRYGLDTQKIHNALGWLPEIGFDEGLSKTVDWYLEVLR